MALEKEQADKDANKRHTMSHPPDHIPDLDSPRQSRSPIKKDKKEKVRYFLEKTNIFWEYRVFMFKFAGKVNKKNIIN